MEENNENILNSFSTKTLNFVFKFFYSFVYGLIFIGDSIRFIITFLIKIVVKIIYSFFVSIGWFFAKTSGFLYFLIKKVLYFLNITFKKIYFFPKKIFSNFFIFVKEKINWNKSKFKIKKNASVFNRALSLNLERAEYFFFGIVFAILVFLGVFVFKFIESLPNPKLIGTVNYPVSTQIFDRKGRLLYEIYRNQNRTPIKIDDLPIYVKQATIAIEDKSFYSHNGISITDGVLRAIKEIVLNGKLQGGSTITQQLVKSSLLTPERTIERKIKEMILALWTERIYTKNQILEMYLNHVPYGGESYGIEEAAKNYFGKNAANLSLAEAAFLAGLPQSPSLYSPYQYPKLAKQRQMDVLSKMKEVGFISEEEYLNSSKEELAIIPMKQNIKAPHFVFYIKQKLEEMYGSSQVEEGGFRVKTSIDLDIQQAAEVILKDELSKIESLNVTNGAILITDPKTGEILAMVGSKDYYEPNSGAFNVVTGTRQPGSSIKPLLYAMAIDKKALTAASTIDDTPITYKISDTENYSPVNYDSKFHGKVTLRLALANSFNIPAVKTLNILGVSDFIDFATNMGISTWTDKNRFGLSLALGGGEVKMTDMAIAFGVLANEGKKIELQPIIKIDNFKGEEIFTSEENNLDINIFNNEQVISKESAFIISSILSDNNARKMAFGPGSALEIKGQQVAVKTGTTNDKRDNWTIGYTPNFLVAVWVGNNNNSPMNQALTSGITGAAPIWNRVVNMLFNSNRSYQGTTFNIPNSLVTKQCYGQNEYFISGTENMVSCREYLFNITPTPTKTP